MDPLQILKDAAKETPAVNYVWGVLAAAAALTVIIGLIKDLKIAFVGICVLLALVIVYFVITQLVQDFPGKRWLTGVLAWVVIFLFLAFLVCLFTSFVFGWPPALANKLGLTSTVLKKSSGEADSAKTVTPMSTPSLLPRLPSPPPSQSTQTQMLVPLGIKQPSPEPKSTPPQDNDPTEGMIFGSIFVEETNIPVPDVHITVKNEQTKLTYEWPSKEDGSFMFSIPHGTYTVTFEHSQFRKLVLPCDTKKGTGCGFYSTQLRKISK